MNLIKRTLFGAIYVALIVASLLLWDVSRILYLVLFAVIAVLATIEASRLLTRGGHPVSRPLQAIDSLGAAAIFTGSYITCTHYEKGMVVALVLTGIYFLLRLTVQLFLAGRDAVADISTSLSAVAYVSLPLAMLNIIVFHFSPMTALLMFIFIWLNDTGAFLVGSATGKHRLFERVSPKKSWEGVIGGLVFVLAAALLLPLIPAFKDALPHNIAAQAVIAIIVIAAATLGDLFESLLKRAAGVKDSGNLIPGHGGILDRIDSLLFTAPAMAATLFIIELAQ